MTLDPGVHAWFCVVLCFLCGFLDASSDATGTAGGDPHPNGTERIDLCSLVCAMPAPLSAAAGGAHPVPGARRARLHAQQHSCGLSIRYYPIAGVPVPICVTQTGS